MVFGEEHDGVGEVVAGEEPAEDGDGLFIAWGCLTINNDDGVEIGRMVLG